MPQIDNKPLASLLITALTLGIGSALLPHEKPKKFECKILIENPHISTFILKNQDKEALKINLKTECVTEQKSATVWVELLRKDKGSAFSIYKFNPVTQNRDMSPYVIEFKGIFKYCDNKLSNNYFALARSQIQLKNGKMENPKGISIISAPIKCGFKI